MKTIVFGGSGFLGSHVADELTRRGHDVVIYDVQPSSYLKQQQKMIVADVLDETKVAHALAQCDYVYNFSGVADLEEARQNPVQAVKANVLGDAIILEASRQQHVKRYVFASSVYVYSNEGSVYRTTKQSCELLIENYQEVYGLDFSILRYGSLYGPRSGDKNWIYSILKQALKEQRIVRKGNGDELREYIHANDAARLSVDILDARYRNQHLLLTGNQQMRVKDFLIMIREMMNADISIEYRPGSYEDHYEITPYIFKPRLAKRLTPPDYIDLGEGLLDLMSIVHTELQQKVV